MTNNGNPMNAKRWLASLACLAAISAGPAWAGPIEYGDFMDVDGGGVVEYLNVREDSPTDSDDGLYGNPAIDDQAVVFNSLDFDPTDFTSSVAFQPEIAGDFTQGQLNFTVETMPGTGIEEIEFAFAGPQLLTGLTDGSRVGLILSGQATVLEVDGQPLATPKLVPFNGSYSVDATQTVNPRWALSVVADLDVGPAFAGASRVEVVATSYLTAVAEPFSIASISVDDVVINPSGGRLQEEFVIPEPSTMTLAALFGAASSLLRLRSRR